MNMKVNWSISWHQHFNPIKVLSETHLTNEEVCLDMLPCRQQLALLVSMIVVDLYFFSKYILAYVLSLRVYYILLNAINLST